MRSSRRAQSITEYVIVLGLVAAALISMQVYVKRGVQAKVKDMTDAFLPAGTVDSGVSQLSNVNPVIPYLDPASGKISSSTSDIANTVTLAGGTLVYNTAATVHSEVHVGQKDPSKKITEGE